MIVKAPLVAALLAAALVAMPEVARSLPPTTYAVKAGIGRSTFGGGDSDNAESALRFPAGVSVDIPVDWKYRIRPEALFTLKGATTVRELGGKTYRTAYEQSYLAFPLLIKAMFGHNAATTRSFVFAGPFVAVALRNRAALTIDGAASSGALDEYMRRYDYGIVLGGGISSGRLSLDTRYNLGLVNILDKDKVTRDYGSATGADLTNHMISVMVGWVVF